MTVECSGNLIKNARAVVVPMSVDLRGIEAAAVLGAVGGDASRELEVLATVTQEDLALTKRLLAAQMCEVRLLETSAWFPLPELMTTGISQPFIRASEPAAAAALARTPTESRKMGRPYTMCPTTRPRWREAALTAPA